MSYTGIGADLVVSAAERKQAEAKIAQIMRANAALKKQYDEEVRRYTEAKALRQKVMTQVAAEAKFYAEARARYDAEVKKIETANRGAGSSYSQALSQWKVARQKYEESVTARSSLLAQQKAASDAVLRKVTPPAGYNGCVTQAQHDAWVQKCKATPNVTVKGLGQTLFGLGGDSAECLWVGLPVCVALPALWPDPGPEPQKPKYLPLPTAPKEPKKLTVPAIPPMPRKPAFAEVPGIIVRDDLPPPPGAEAQPKSFAVAGLLALVIVGGGAAYYFTHKKKKAAA